MAAVVKIIEWLVISLMAFVTCLVFAEIVLRDAFGLSLIITEEAARYAMIWVTMLGSALLVADDAHIRIDLIPSSLPEGLRLALRLISQALVLLFLAVLTGATLTILPEVARDRTVTLGVTMDVIYLAFPVGSLLMIALTLRNMVRAVSSFRARPAAVARVEALR